MRSYMNELTKVTCHGYRLNDQALSTRVDRVWDRASGKCQIYRLRDHLKSRRSVILTDNEVTVCKTDPQKRLRIAWTFLNNVAQH